VLRRTKVEGATVHSRFRDWAGKALIVANHFLETDLEKLRAVVSLGCTRGKLFEVAQTLTRDRKDWYD
jgi:hypothetical protein